ncbi:adenosine deaminase [Candidatus Poribacteria bacterium]|nr:adenosine deaminase [Candidatus Poribacteria bacterium]
MEAGRQDNLFRAIEQMPKVELHVHLEGSIPSRTIERLAQRNSIDVAGLVINPETGRHRFGHLINFLDSYRLRCKCLREVEDFEEACVDVLENLHSQNVRYAEITIAPTMSRLYGISMETVMRGIDAGATRVAREKGIEARFIFDVGRQFGHEHAWQTVREALENQARGVIAVGLGGDELHYSPEIFVKQFEFARKEGLHVVAHAGEVVGSASVWGAVTSLGAERIGHGLGARADEQLLEYMRIHNIAVDMCPTSNVATGATRSYADHPLPDYLRRGLLITLNSDDPDMFGSSLTDEYKVSSEMLGLDWQEIKTLCLNGVRAGFLPDLYKKNLFDEFSEAFARIESETPPALNS